MWKTAIVVASMALLSGCQSYLNHRYPPGHMGPDGKIYPCNSYRTDHQACGNALWNSPRLVLLKLGQSRDEARQVMGRDPEKLSMKAEAGRSSETWEYIFNYNRSIYTIITFVDDKIAAIEQVQR